jgi:type III secretory pathway component EscS
LEPSTLHLIGTILAIVGSLLSISGALANNLYHWHRTAMEIWTVSNILLAAWAMGYYIKLWDGGLSAIALCVMYVIFLVSNWYGLRKYKVDDSLKNP